MQMGYGYGMPGMPMQGMFQQPPMYGMGMQMGQPMSPGFEQGQ